MFHMQKIEFLNVQHCFFGILSQFFIFFATQNNSINEDEIAINTNDGIKRLKVNVIIRYIIDKIKKNDIAWWSLMQFVAFYWTVLQAYNISIWKIPHNNQFILMVKCFGCLWYSLVCLLLFFQLHTISKVDNIADRSVQYPWK